MTSGRRSERVVPVATAVPDATGPGAVALDTVEPNAAPIVPIMLVSAAAIGLGGAGANTIGYLASFIQEDLDIGRALVGAASSAYFGATGLGAFAAGRLVARAGARRSLLVGLGGLACGSAIVTGIGTFPALVVYAVVAGFAYALSTVATNVAVAAVVPLRRRAVGLTTKTAGGPLLSSAFALTAGFFVGSLGWRAILGFLGVGAVGVMVATAIVFTHADVRPREQHASVAVGRLPSAVFVLALGSFLLAAGSQPLFSWLLPYLVDELELAEGSAGMVTAASTATGVVGMIAVALLSDRLGPRQRLIVLAVASASAMLATLVLALATRDQLGLVLASAAVGIVSYTGAIGVMHAATVDLAPRAVERASGVVLTGFYFGAWSSPFLFGMIADASGFRAAWLSSAAALLVGVGTFTGTVAAARRAIAEA